MKSAILTVVYTQEKKFIDDYVLSINSQTSKQFDVILFDDGIESSLLHYLMRKIEVPIRLIRQNHFSEINTFASSRMTLVKYALDHDYKIIHFCDFDDAFTSNRIATVQNKIQAGYICFHDVIKFSTTNNSFSIGKIPLSSEMSSFPQTIMDFKENSESNFIGFSNSSLNLERINFDFGKFVGLMNENKVVDWPFFSILLLANFKAIKVKNVYTYYRIHDSNIGNENKIPEKDKILNEIQNKVIFYGVMKNYHSDYKRLYDIYFGFDKKLKMNQLEIQQDSFLTGGWWGNYTFLER